MLDGLRPVTYLIFGVVRAHQLDVSNGSGSEIQILPRTAMIFLIIDDTVPLLLIYRHLNEIRIRSIVLVPQQYFYVIDDADGAEFNNNARVIAVDD